MQKIGVTSFDGATQANMSLDEMDMDPKWLDIVYLNDKFYL